MALPKQITFVTFDVYGTLIDWESGATDAFVKEAARDGFTIDPADLVPRFHEVQQQIQAGSYELYAEVLRRTAVQIAKDLGWPLEPSRSGFLPDSVQRWPAFKETNATLTKIAKKHSIGLISNIDDKLLGLTRRHLQTATGQPMDFDLVVTAQQVRSYKPDPAHFTECERRVGTKKGWVHVAASYYHDVEPCLKKKIPVIWVNRHGAELEAGQKKPDAEVRTLKEAAKLILEAASAE
ncbi:MAG TPA: HAD-IA family hydrolase [Solirubrobacteraceae bacterium]|nr:HAD-IA family hydrolase [Solirubrobacteraceae bacterium]